VADLAGEEFVVPVYAAADLPGVAAGRRVPVDVGRAPARERRQLAAVAAEDDLVVVRGVPPGEEEGRGALQTSAAAL
jgi:hypothetical protein